MTFKQLFVVGATASGKSALALEIARRLGGAIVSADSMQIYKGLDVGTAKPTAEERAVCPHYMIDIVEPNCEYSVAEYSEQACSVIEQLRESGKVAVVAGGTGLYVDALAYPMTFSDSDKDTAYREELNKQADEEGLVQLHAILATKDPITAARVSANDRKRIVRALEILHTTGKPMSAMKDERKARYDCKMIALDYERQTLYDRINARVDYMFEQGLIDEVNGIVDRYGIDCFSFQSMKAIGYREFSDYYTGAATLEQVKDTIKRHTRNYAKRQLTWYRNKNVEYYAPYDINTAIESAIRFITQ